MVCYWFDAISWVVNQQLKQLSHFCGPLIYCYTPILEPSDAPLVLVATRYAIKLHRSFRFSDISLWRSETACESMWFCMKYRSYHRFGLMAYDGLPRIPFNSRCNYVHLSRPFIYHWFMYIYIYIYICMSKVTAEYQIELLYPIWMCQARHRMNSGQWSSTGRKCSPRRPDHWLVSWRGNRAVQSRHPCSKCQRCLRWKEPGKTWRLVRLVRKNKLNL